MSKGKSADSTYAIKLPQFEGPFDLLLYFIERDELDIYDIPIASITDDFLNYMHEMNSLDIELASEFILVAATLMRIKAKTLLPRKELDEQGNIIDPRTELINRLLEYKKYKAILKDMEVLEDARMKQVERGNIEDDLKNITKSFSTELELHDLSLYKLLTVFERVLNKLEDRQNVVEHKVVQYPYTISEQKTFLVNLVKKAKDKLPFDKIFANCQNRIHAVFLFLALLELVQLQTIRLQPGLGINNFWISNNA